MVGAVALMIYERKEPRHALAQVDWTLPLSFAALFMRRQKSSPVIQRLIV